MFYFVYSVINSIVAWPDLTERKNEKKTIVEQWTKR